MFYTVAMADSFLDHIPSHEQQRLRRMMSPEAYERLREKVKGPEDLEKEMDGNALMAELKFALETDPEIQQLLKERVATDISKQGIEAMLDGTSVDAALKIQLEQGRFSIGIASHPATHTDQLVVMPEGNVQESIPLMSTVSDRYVRQFIIGNL
ncbi:MAG: hypothetical protein JWM56_1044 [Candidatus Peribacteria bacterium]|nr:hypothetical protein [Candidatus Peribacteria bacterium]